MGNWFQRLCCKITKHKLRYGFAWTETEPIEFYYKCLICRKWFWNYKPHRKYIRWIDERARANERSI